MSMCQMIRFLFIVFLFVVIKCANNCKKLDQFCYCDEKCHLYGDCCPGHSNFNKTGILNKVLSCTNMFNRTNIWVIDKCADKEHPLEKYCSRVNIKQNNRLQSLIPVITDEGFIFGNNFCALCNNKKQFQYVQIKIKFFTYYPNNFDEVNKLINNGSSYNIDYMIPKKAFRTCQKNLIRHCPTDFNIYGNKSIEYLCQNKVWNEVFVVTDGRLFYRNDDCCSCWNKTCYARVFSDVTFFGGFSYLLNFNQWVKEVKERPLLNDTGQNKTISTKTEKAIYYTSFIFTILSLFSLIFLIIIYVSQRIFHTFGGYLTICLCCCLFIMNFIMILVKSETITKSSLCRSIGIMQHFIALSNFIWMAIYALDLLQTFGIESGNRNKKKTFKTFIIYCVFGFGINTIIVGAAVIAEFNLNNNSTIRPLYGGEYCWFTSKFGGIVWYFIPTCILLVWNLFACIVVFYKLSKTAKECRVVKQKESNTTLWLCVRLTAVFGIGYILQIIAILSGVYGLIIAGSLLNCLQGCLLATCFIWTKRVITVVTTTIASVTGSTNTNSTGQSRVKEEKKFSKDDQIN